MARPRDQFGSLQEVSGRGGRRYWRIRWSIYGPDGVRREKMRTIGVVGEMEEPEARDVLRRIVQSSRAFSSLMNAPALRTYSTAPTKGFSSIGARRGASGAFGQIVVTADLLARGFEVYSSVNPLGPCDLIYEMDGAFFRVEVKVAEVIGGRAQCDLVHNAGKFDLLAVVARDGIVHYAAAHSITSLKSPEVFPGSEIELRDEDPQNGPQAIEA